MTHVSTRRDFHIANPTCVPFCSDHDDPGRYDHQLGVPSELFRQAGEKVVTGLGLVAQATVQGCLTTATAPKLAAQVALGLESRPVVPTVTTVLIRNLAGNLDRQSVSIRFTKSKEMKCMMNVEKWAEQSLSVPLK